MNVDLLVSGFSSEKLKTFKNTFNCTSESETIAVYMAIQEICNHYFSLIHILEINLRNAIHKAATEYFKDEDWFTSFVVGDKSKSQVAFAINKCIENVGVKYTSDDVIAQLSFGFWVHMLSPVYNNPRNKELNLWQFKFKSVFPNAREKKLSFLFQELGTLNTFRNRLFHHEPVWKHRKVKGLDDALARLQTMYAAHIRFLGWISSGHVKLHKELEFQSRFNQSCNRERVDLIVKKLGILI